MRSEPSSTESQEQPKLVVAESLEIIRISIVSSIERRPVPGHPLSFDVLDRVQRDTVTLRHRSLGIAAARTFFGVAEQLSEDFLLKRLGQLGIHRFSPG